MKRLILGVLAAVFVHVLILLFGGIFFLGSGDKDKKVTVEDVDVLEDADEKKPDRPKPEELETRKADEVEAPQEKPPELQQLVEIEQQEPSLADATPELSAMSLAALETALDPSAAAGDSFGGGGSLASGGRIGGTGAADAGGEAASDVAFSLADLDQAARPIFQAAPAFPMDLRKRKIEGVVTLQFVVDPEGRVVEPKVERSTDPGFEGPALDAVRRWKFEPAMRGGKKVPSKLRIPIRFSLKS